MKFPEKYIKHGNFVLHSGQRSKILYDVNGMITDDHFMYEILRSIPDDPLIWNYTGIATAGAIIARVLAKERGKTFSMIKDGELKGKRPVENWFLIDDVITTGKSLLEAKSIVGSNPSKIFVVLDRREKNENPFVKSIFQP